jgi:hypothetical protein
VTWRPPIKVYGGERIPGSSGNYAPTPPARDSSPKRLTWASILTPTFVIAQVIEERIRELYLEGHHIYDLRRFDIPNTPPPGTNYRQGGVYGSARCFPLPALEKDNNPNFR